MLRRGGGGGRSTGTGGTGGGGSAAVAYRGSTPPTHTQLPPTVMGKGPCAVETSLQRVEALRAPLHSEGLFFEGAVLGTLALYSVVQHYNVCRWNVHNYNLPLLMLSLIILSRRLLWNYISWDALVHPPSLSSLQLTLNGVVLAWVLVNFVYCLVQLVLQQPLHKIVLLFCPCLVFAALFRGGTLLFAKGTDGLWVRMQMLLFTSVESAYYATFLPFKLLKNGYLFYDAILCWIVTVFAVLTLFVLLCTRFLSTSLLELYLHSVALGHWRIASARERRSVEGPIALWTPKASPYTRGAIVIHRGRCYVASTDTVVCKPGDGLSWFLFFLLRDPEGTHRFLIYLQSLVTLVQMALVLNSSRWNTLTIPIMINYGVLYTCFATRRENLPFYSFLTHRLKR